MSYEQKQNLIRIDNNIDNTSNINNNIDTNIVSRLEESFTSNSSNTFLEGDDEKQIVLTLQKQLKIQREQINMLKKQKTMDEYKTKIIKDDYNKLESNYISLQEENTNNLNEIIKLKQELKQYRDKSDKTGIHKIKGKIYS